MLPQLSRAGIITELKRGTMLLTKLSEMQANAANLSTSNRKDLDNIGKQIDYCREYHDRLHVVADKQIGFDLDDGVIVNYAKFRDVLVKLK